MPRTKAEVLADSSSALNKAANDELVFVLREKDPLFHMMVRAWAHSARDRMCHEPEKFVEAMNIARLAEVRRPDRYKE